MFKRKEKIFKKVPETFLGQINALKQLLPKHHTTNHQVKKYHSYFLHPQVVKQLLMKQTIRRTILMRKNMGNRMIYFTKSVAVTSDVVDENVERKSFCLCH